MGFLRAHFFLAKYRPDNPTRQAGDMMESVETIGKRIEEAISPLLAHDGYDLVLVEYLPGPKILRLYIDREGGITLDDCSRVSRIVSDLLDAEGLVEGAGGVEGHYTLEVSSPGLDRPLVRPAHFQRFVGHNVVVAAVQPFAELKRRKVTGKLVEANEQGISVEAEGQVFSVVYDAIEKARLVPEL
jgi:ribosome maturation factor RimP